MRCEQHGCEADAVGGYLWPGHEALMSCATHLLKARKVAEVLGFVLHELPLEAFLVPRAARTVQALQEDSGDV